MICSSLKRSVTSWPELVMRTSPVESGSWLVAPCFPNKLGLLRSMLESPDEYDLFDIAWPENRYANVYYRWPVGEKAFSDNAS